MFQSSHREYDMKYIQVLSIGLLSALSSMPALAGENDFHALNRLAGASAPLAAEQLAAVEGGQLVGVQVAVPIAIANITQLNLAALSAGALQGNLGGVLQVPLGINLLP
jgi:hypothetical protein